MSVKQSKYRLRVFQTNDPAPVVNIVFEDDAAPLNADGTPQTLLVDQDVVQVTTVSPHVETPAV